MDAILSAKLHWLNMSLDIIAKKGSSSSPEILWDTLSGQWLPLQKTMSHL